MPRGPLPSDPATTARRNKPTIPTTKLPAGGCPNPVPDPPEWVELGVSGSGWWVWAWSTPQAAAWSVGDGPMVARRASLEDDLSALSQVDSLDLADVMDVDDIRAFRNVISRLAGLATGRLQVMREMRELDDRLGLTPKGMAQLRWTIVADETPEAEVSEAENVASLDRRRRLTANAS